MAGTFIKSLVFGVAFSLFAAPAFAADTIKVGHAGAHSGDLAAYGVPSLNAVKIVVDMYNKNGGINGKQIELFLQDDQCKPELATNAATKLLSDGAEVIIGHICTGATKASLPIYRAANIVSVSPSATDPVLTQSGENPHFFRTIPSDDAQARLGANFVVDKLQAKKVAILHDKGDYGKGYASFVKKFLEESGKVEVVLFEGVTPGAVDYSAVVQKVRGSKADVVVFGGYYPEASKIVMQMKKKRMKTAFVSEDGVMSNMFLKLAGKNAEGVYASSGKDVSSLPMYKKAMAQHIEMFGSEPGQFYEEGYSATVALLEAIKAAGSTDTEKVKAALRANKVSTPVGEISFDAKGDAVGVGFSMYQVQKGTFIELQ